MQGHFHVNSTETEVFKRGSYTGNLSTKQKHKVTGLIDEKCLIKVLLNNKLSSVLLDTGGQVSVINDKYLRENFPHVDEHPDNELLDEPDSLRVQWGNQTEKLFQTSFDQTDVNRIQAFVNLLQTPECE